MIEPPGTPGTTVVFESGLSGVHCGTRQQLSLGSVTIVQPGFNDWYVGHLCKKYSEIISSIVR